MSSTTPNAGAVQDQAENKPRPRRWRIPRTPREPSPATRKRRIKIERAVNLIGRTKCGVQIAARAVGLHGRVEMQALCDALDARGIPRKGRWGWPAWRTMENVEAFVARPAPLRPGDEWRVLDEYVPRDQKS